MFPSCSLVAASVLDLTQTEVPGTRILPGLLTAERPPLDISVSLGNLQCHGLILRPELCSRMRLTGDVSMLPLEASRCFQFQSCSPHRSHEPHLEQRWSSHSLQRASPVPIPSRSMLSQWSAGQGSHPCWPPNRDGAQHDLQHRMADEPNTTHCGVCKPFIFLAVQSALGKFTVF